MPDFYQKVHWNRLYQQDRSDEGPPEPGAFARETEALLADRSRILELGCGEGRDSAFFARSGHTVVAVDFSDVIIARNCVRFRGQSRLSFVVADLAEPLPFADAAFDLVYARLSLHYFRDSITKRLFGEIRTVLKSNGLLRFMCKSVKDPLYGRGEQIEPDMFIHKGHVRHFFSEEYARQCLQSGYALQSIHSSEGLQAGRISGLVTVVARTV